MLTIDQKSALLDLRICARDVAERAAVAYWTDETYHMQELQRQLDRLEQSINEFSLLATEDKETT